MRRAYTPAVAVEKEACKAYGARRYQRAMRKLASVKRRSVAESFGKYVEYVSSLKADLDYHSERYQHCLAASHAYNPIMDGLGLLLSSRAAIDKRLSSPRDISRIL